MVLMNIIVRMNLTVFEEKFEWNMDSTNKDIIYNYANIREFTPFSIRENKQRKTLPNLSLTADVQQRALLPSNQSQNLNQDQTSDEDISDDTDSDEENSKKQLQTSTKKSFKSKPTNKSINDDLNNSVIQIKRLLGTIFPTTSDVYGFHLDEPSTESLNCYEQYAKMACNTRLLPRPSTLSSSNKQHRYKLTTRSSISSNSSFEIIGLETKERAISTQPHDQPIENQALRISLMSMFDEPIVSDESIRIYEQSVAVGHQGPFEPSDVDRKAYEEYVASLMIPVQS